jgi:hypothetical protein
VVLIVVGFLIRDVVNVLAITRCTLIGIDSKREVEAEFNVRPGSILSSGSVVMAFESRLGKR